MVYSDTNPPLHHYNRYRYIVAMAVADYSGQAWLQGFNDVGQVIFGMSADELMEIKVSGAWTVSDTRRC